MSHKSSRASYARGSFIRAFAEPSTVVTLAEKGAGWAISSYAQHVNLHGPVHALTHIVLPDKLGILPVPADLPFWANSTWSFITDNFSTLGHVLHDLNTVALPLSFAFPVLRLLNWLFLNTETPEHVCRILRGSEIVTGFHGPTQLNVDYAPLAAIRDAAQSHQPMAVGLPAHVDELMSIANKVGVMRGTADVLHARYTDDLRGMNDNLARRNPVRIPKNAVVGFERFMHDLAPEYAYQRFSMHHPHPECDVGRKVFFSLALREANRIGKPVVLAGASNLQACQTPNLVHNHRPELTGRDNYRHHHDYAAAINQHADRVSCTHTLEACPQRFPGTTLILPLSANDINVREVIKSMILNDQRDALVIMHLPVPFIDGRIREWCDDEMDVRFERKGGRISMYHRGAASAGYHNGEESTMSWLKPLPYFPSWHVQVEELRSAGSLYLLHLRVAKGKQEEYPCLWKVGSGRFYILPILKPQWRFHADEDAHFVVPATRFDNVAKFAAITPGGRNDYVTVGNKIRGQEAEIKVADKVILPRWTMTHDQFNSCLTHALIKGECMRRDNEVVLRNTMGWMDYWYGRMDGSPVTRYLHYMTDLVTLAGVRRQRGMFERSPYAKLADGFFATYMVEGKMEDPYAPHGMYRVHHGEVDKARLLLERFTAALSEVKSDRGVPAEKPLPKIKFEAPVTDCGVQCEPFTYKVSIGSQCDEQSFKRTSAGAGLQQKEEVEKPATQGENKKGKGVDFSETLGGDRESLFTDNSGGTDGDDEGRRPEPASVATPQSGTESIVTDEDDKATSFYSSLPQPEHNDYTLYQVAERSLERWRESNGRVDFEGDISFNNPLEPTPSQLLFSRLFFNVAGLCQALRSGEFMEIPCPDRGAKKLVETILANSLSKRAALGFSVADYALEVITSTKREMEKKGEMVDEEGGLLELMRTFFDEVDTCEAAYKRPTLCLNGLPASAKSTLARMCLGNARTLVVVPSRKLAQDWRNHVGASNVEVTTQHRLPGRDRYDLMVIDEANLLGKKHLRCWMALARKLRVRDVICLGDEYQRGRRTDEDAAFGIAPLDVPTIKFFNTFGLPLDALMAFLLVNGLTGDDRYRTLSKRRRSIVIVGRTNARPEEYPRLPLYTRARLTASEVVDPHGRVMPSITQSQGLRVKKHYFTPGLAPRGMNWISEMLAVQSVLFTRHTDQLILDMHSGNFNAAFPTIPIEAIQVINGKSQSKLLRDRAVRSGDLDLVMMGFSFPEADQRYMSAAVPLEVSLENSDRLVSINPDPDPTMVPEDKSFYHPISSTRLAIEVILPRIQYQSRRDFKEELDFIASAAHGLISCGELGFGEEPKLKFHLPGASALGDIQMARDRYHDLRNMCLRQLNEKHRMFITTQDVADAKVVFDRYCKSFMKKEFQARAIAEYGYDYFSSRSNAFVQGWNDPFGYAASSFRRNAFLKTQVKVKPGLNGQETHGQTIIANEPELTNYFGPYARMGYVGMNFTDRDDFITDTGFSDEELSRALIERGVGARISSERNIQMDLTRQDSTHRPAHVIAYCTFLEFCGVPSHVTELYLLIRSMSYVKSLAQNLYKAVINWNLGSGDPFTLNANCFMMKSSLATRYDGLEYCAGIQKGDDFIGTLTGLVFSPVQDVYARLEVVVKEDVDLPPYHAGRFLIDGALVADPVRAFFRHFAKTHDPGTSLGEIYRSYVERRVNYTTEQAEYLKVVIPLFYKDLNHEEANYVVDFMLSLRSFKLFSSTYKHSNREVNDIFDPTRDCAFQTARKLAPQLSKQRLRRYRNHTSQETLKKLFEEDGIPVVCCGHPFLAPRGHVGAVITPSHVFALLKPTPGY